MAVRLPILVPIFLVLFGCDTSEDPSDCIENGPDFEVGEAKGHVTIDEGDIDVAPDLHGTGWLTVTGSADDGHLEMDLDWNGPIEWSEGSAEGFLLPVVGDVVLREDWRGPYLYSDLGANTEGVPDSSFPEALSEATVEFEHVVGDVWVNLTIDEVLAALGVPGGIAVEHEPCSD